MSADVSAPPGFPAEWREWRVVPDRLRYWSDKDPDRAFLQCGAEVDDRSWLTFGTVAERSAALAGGFAECGVRQGDRVAVILPNREEYLVIFFALATLGAVQVPINPFLKGEFLKHQLLDSGALAVVGDGPALAQIAGMASDLPDLRLGVGVGDLRETPSGTLLLGDLEAAGSRPPATRIESSDLLAVVYTSGTTGAPKGCMLSHGYYLAMAWPWFQNGWLHAGDRVITAMPLFHIGGQGVVLMPALLAGNAVAYLHEFRARRFLGAARDSGATYAHGVGAMAMAMLATPESDLDRAHSLRFASFMPMPTDAQERFERRFGVMVRSEAYGQTECNPVTGAPVDRPASKRGSLGRAMAAFDVRVHDEHGVEQPAGTVGEIVVRPREPDVMFSGYWRNPAATAESWRALWHHTGDLGRVDQDGYLHFVDRKKDAIRRRGENISSAEVEAAMLVHPKITAVAVCALPSELGEDDMKAYLVTDDGAEFEPAELHRFLTETLPYFAVPRYVEFVDALPLTPTGRVQKHVLRERGVGDAWDFDVLGFTVARAERR